MAVIAVTIKKLLTMEVSENPTTKKLQRMEVVTMTVSEKSGGDIESGVWKKKHVIKRRRRILMEDYKIQWGFIGKVYALICIQLAITFGVVSIFINNMAAFKTFLMSSIGTIFFIVDELLIFFSLGLMILLGKKHPWNYILMVALNMFISFMVGSCMICEYKQHEPPLLEATCLVVLFAVGLILNVFWAATKGYSLSFVEPFLLWAYLLFVGMTIMQMFFSFGRWEQMVNRCLGVLTSCGFVIFVAKHNIKAFSRDDNNIVIAAMLSHACLATTFMLCVFLVL